MSQHDYDIADASGAVVRADINSVLEAIASLNSGATAPSVTFAGMLWYDTANGVVKQRNAANTAWGTPYFSGLPTLATANVFTQSPQYLRMTDTGTLFRCERSSSGPAAAGNDLGGLECRGEDSGGTLQTYSRFGGTITDPAGGAREGTADIWAPVAGTFVKRVRVGGGLYTANAAGGDKGAETINADQVFAGGVLIPRSYLSGYGLSNNAVDSEHDIDIAAGFSTDSANTVYLSLASAITKRIDATWASGTGNGGLSSSLTAPANNTWYHVFAIVVGGSVDVGFDTSITAANLVADHSATAYRRLGAVKTDASANILAFAQVGSTFMWVDPPLDYDVASPGTSAVTATLSTPLGVVTEAIVNLYSSSAGTYLSPLSVNDEAVSQTAAPLGTSYDTGDNHATQARVLTNTSSQVRARQITNATLRIATLGYVDQRGRDD